MGNACSTASVQNCRGPGVDGKRSRIVAGETGVYRRPRSAAVRRSEDAIVVSYDVQRGEGLWIDDKRLDAAFCQAGIHAFPCATVVGRAEDTIAGSNVPVSYTHLTLPTIYSV